MRYITSLRREIGKSPLCAFLLAAAIVLLLALMLVIQGALITGPENIEAREAARRELNSEGLKSCLKDAEDAAELAWADACISSGTSQGESTDSISPTCALYSGLAEQLQAREQSQKQDCIAEYPLS